MEPTPVLVETTSLSNQEYSFEDAQNKLGFGRYQIYMFIICGIVYAADSMEVILISFLRPEIKEYWPDTSPFLDSTLASATFSGMFLGTLIWGVVSDLYGRKKCFLALVFIAALFGMLSSICSSITLLILCRFMVGFGIGATPAVYSLVVEFMPTALRGKILLLFSLNWSIGAIIEVGIAWFILPRYGWRWFLGVSALPMFFLIGFYPFVPESSRYLLLRGEKDKLMTILKKIADINRKKLPEGELIVKQISVGGRMQYLPSLLSPSLVKITIVLWFLWFMASFLYYGVVFITPKFVPIESVYSSTLISTVAEIPSCLIACLMVDRFGRKISTSVYYAIGGFFFLLLTVVKDQALIIICLFGARFGTSGAFTLLYVYTPEVYPTAIRSTAFSVCAAWSRVSIIVSPYIETFMIAQHKSLPMLVYGICCILSTLFAIYLPVETANQDLRDEVETSLREDHTKISQEPEDACELEKIEMAKTGEDDETELEEVVDVKSKVKVDSELKPKRSEKKELEPLRKGEKVEESAGLEKEKLKIRKVNSKEDKLWQEN